MNNYKIKVNDEAESKEAQALFEQLGYKFTSMHQNNYSFMQVFADGSGSKYEMDDGFCDELTLPQLRDLVAKSKFKVREYLDPARGYMYIKLTGCEVKEQMLGNEKWIEIPESAVMALKHHDSEDIFFQNTYPIGLYVTRPKLVWDRQSTQEQGLISGREALERIAEGVVQYKCSKDPVADRWTTITDHFWDQYNLGVFLNKDTTWSFRLKPRTIKLEIEIPEPFEPKEGEEAWCLDGHTLNGYKKLISDIFVDPGIGFWRTEEEIKQVVAALRGIKG